MKRVVLACLLLAGCAQRMEPQNEPIALFYTAQEASKTDALAAGDEVTVSASVEGTQHYFLDAHRFVVGSDGRTLTAQPAVLYPDAKQAIAFYAYFGSQSVPTDQSTAAALKSADLCWASASSTPSSAAVPLSFNHVFARLVVTCSQPTSKILIPSAFSGGSLDVRTGSFANSTKSDVFTAQSELILPAQTLNRLIITSGGVEYIFDGSISLESGKTTTLNLTLNTAAKTAALQGSSVAAWTASTQSGGLESVVSNVLSFHWPNFLQQGATPDKIVLTINGSDYAISNGIGYANSTFTVPFASSVLRYPYQITKISFYNGSVLSMPACTQIVGAIVYKSAAATLGIKDPTPNVVRIGNVWWATGNLVADGPNNCKIGTPSDCGLYFQFGSLVGWSGGAAPAYDGTGTPSVVDAAVKVAPLGYTGGTTWGTVGRFTQAGTAGINTNFNTQPGGENNPTTGVGDPCSFYLSPNWSTPTMADFNSLYNYTSYGCTLPRGGWVYNSSYYAHYHAATGLRILASGRRISSGVIQYVLENHDYNTCSLTGPTTCYIWNTDHVNLYNVDYPRTLGFPVRCVYK